MPQNKLGIKSIIDFESICKGRTCYVKMNQTRDYGNVWESLMRQNNHECNAIIFRKLKEIKTV